jgi:hypothetical protein
MKTVSLVSMGALISMVAVAMETSSDVTLHAKGVSVAATSGQLISGAGEISFATRMDVTSVAD